MIRVRRGLFPHFLLLILALPCGGHARAESNAAFITLTLDGDTLRAAYHLDRPLTGLIPGRGPVAWQNPVWRVETPGMEMRDQQVRATEPWAAISSPVRPTM
ncbi:hypothetical protein FBZ89_110137 [Nitrospirillum amazonense]|uniref:Uncharacterized protein n=1 Tax=Nitrospirillum amazonense TaxID=28077 RepID=A0A560FA39_9PROT|nr:hypothetical protein [Nitrospirillum amazonense]TWB18488.1 hypothetical protein FBZ89_110137 [Nitrospirillum amazonense]